MKETNDLDKQMEELRKSYGRPPKREVQSKPTKMIYVKMKSEMTQAEWRKHILCETLSALFILVTSPCYLVSFAWPLILGILLTPLFDWRGGLALAGFFVFMFFRKPLCEPAVAWMSEQLGKVHKAIDRHDPAIYEK